MSEIHYLFNNNIVVLTNGIDVIEVKSQDNQELFQRVVNACMEDRAAEAFDMIADSSAEKFIAQRLSKITDGMLSLDPQSDQVIFTSTDGRKLPIVATFAQRIRDAWSRKDELALGVYKLFMIKASNNPNDVSASDLFEFVTVNKLPLSLNGDVLAYKIVKSSFMDIHSNTKDHTPGNIVTEENVDYNRDVTCSNGLHFCSKDYLPAYGGSFGGGDSSNKLVLLQIDPADVAAFPRDYHNAKGRCRQYTVVSELPTEMFTAIVSLMEQVPFVDVAKLGASYQIVERLGKHVDSHNRELQVVNTGSTGTVSTSIVVVPNNRWYVSLKADNQPTKLVYKAVSRAEARDKVKELTVDISLRSINGSYMGMSSPIAAVYDSWA